MYLHIIKVLVQIIASFITKVAYTVSASGCTCISCGCIVVYRHVEKISVLYIKSRFWTQKITEAKLYATQKYQCLLIVWESLTHVHDYLNMYIAIKNSSLLEFFTKFHHP